MQILGTKMGPETSHFGDRRAKTISTGAPPLGHFCFWCFGAFWVPLGSLLGRLEALLESLWTQKRVKATGFLRVMKRLFFGL